MVWRKIIGTIIAKRNPPKYSFIYFTCKQEAQMNVVDEDDGWWPTATGTRARTKPNITHSQALWTETERRPKSTSASQIIITTEIVCVLLLPFFEKIREEKNKNKITCFACEVFPPVSQLLHFTQLVVSCNRYYSSSDSHYIFFYELNRARTNSNRVALNEVQCFIFLDVVIVVVDMLRLERKSSVGKRIVCI